MAGVGAYAHASADSAGGIPVGLTSTQVAVVWAASSTAADPSLAVTAVGTSAVAVVEYATVAHGAGSRVVGWVTGSGDYKIEFTSGFEVQVLVCDIGSLAPVVSPCGITDAFARVLASGLGTSDSTLVWTGDSSYSPDDGLSVDGSHAVIVDRYNLSGFANFVGSFLGPIPASNEFRVKFSFSLIDANEPVLSFAEWKAVSVVATSTSPSTDSGVLIGSGGGGTVAFLSFTFSEGVTYAAHYLRETDGACHLNVWDAAGTEPAGWMVSGNNIHDLGSTFPVGYEPSSDRYPSVGTVLVSDLDIVGVNRCTSGV